MKEMRELLLTGIMALLCSSIGSAQIIYSNAFNGGAVNIWGTGPTVAVDYAGGTGSATWNDALGTNDTGIMQANGLDESTAQDSWLLPFYPQSGYVYTLTASLTFTGNPGGWVGLGFAENDSVNVPINYGRFADSGNDGPTGYNWMILTESSGNAQYFTGPKANTPQVYNGTGFNGGPQTLTVQVILNTISSLWSMTAYVNGVQLGNLVTYANNPPIGAIGITQNGLTASTAVQWNYLTLGATGTGPTTNNVSVSFSPTNAGLPLNRSFDGLSYEKEELTGTLFTSSNTALVKLFSTLGPAVLRIGGGSVDQTGWNGISNTVPITGAEVDRFAGFVDALPTNWAVIYGINLRSNTPANCAAEAAYVASDLGPRLLGFEIGNEPGAEYSQYASFLADWQSLAAAITNTVPGWAVTNGGNGWILAGTDAVKADLSTYTEPFAIDESGMVSLLTQHYYVGVAGSTNDTLQLLFKPNPSLVSLVTNIAKAAAGHCTLGARITECGSFSHDGQAGVSDAFGAALWSLDYMFTVALNGGQGINFHGGGKSPYSPVFDNGTNVTAVGPEFYGLKMLSLIPSGNVIPAIVTPASNTNFTAYGVRQADGSISALLNNKDPSDAVAVGINLGPGVTGAQLIKLAAPSLSSTTDFTLGGATIDPDGTWIGGVQAVMPATNGQLTVSVPPYTAVLLNPVFMPTNLTFSVAGNQLSLNWPMRYFGWMLQSNSTALENSNWRTVPGSTDTNCMQFTIQPGQRDVFYRLSSP
ncbi:MAG TPA: glycosyl hydrolase family 79 C-terminal domain-containing protein [Verrucomicrobiae bacterium]|jgi:hypothetical protein|nr:glycosyl hydrolase family 79 C-terminal domain-containing protein [Verrucomicrobiae bacterium]